MQFMNILCAYDGSKISKQALENAAALAKSNPGAVLDVVHVASMPSLVVGEALIATPAVMSGEYYEAAEEIAEEARQRLLSLSQPADVHILNGNPGRMIIEHAERTNRDLIIIGSRGLNGVREWVLGSVSHYVVQHAKIPVLVIK
ncbi:universal stress protein [Paenibacillus sp. FJAT-26967]|uniref:universal stress protein n=1 Tax=Paenibacillus sp. FJAT-26967 TaxID=1729690 RepID=UPI0008395787|nr:universal stress protein [Paenibacillus sp. FJAT-26967]